MLLSSYNVDVILLNLSVRRHLPNNRCENGIKCPLSIKNRQSNLSKTTRLSIVYLFLETQNDKLSPRSYTEMPAIQPLTNNSINDPLDQIQTSILLTDADVVL